MRETPANTEWNAAVEACAKQVEAAQRILIILGCTDESGNVFRDDVARIAEVISYLTKPGERAAKLLQAYVADEITTARLFECIRLWSEANDFVLPGEAHG